MDEGELRAICARLPSLLAETRVFELFWLCNLLLLLFHTFTNVEK